MEIDKSLGFPEYETSSEGQATAKAKARESSKTRALARDPI